MKALFKGLLKGLSLSGHGLKASEKVRIWWFALTLVFTGCVADEAPWWGLLLIAANLILSGLSIAAVSNKLKDDEKEEI